MTYYRCKCGYLESWGSGMMPAKCHRCPKCKSNLSWSPKYHEEPLEHDFSRTEDVETDDGMATLSRCKYCYRTRKQIEQREAKEVEDGSAN